MSKKIFIGSYATRLNKKNYSGWDGWLKGVKPDIIDASKMAELHAFDEIILLENEKMTAENLIAIHRQVAALAVAGDLIVWWHSGHGADKVEDGGANEIVGAHNDKLDEALCLFDRLLPDNFVQKMLSIYKFGVNLVCVADTCHAGEIYKNFKINRHVVKSMPKSVQKSTAPEAWNWSFLSDLLPTKTAVKANLIWIGACQPDQTSADLGTNGLFTRKFLDAYQPKMTWKQWFAATKKTMPPDQTPQISVEKQAKKLLNSLAF